MCFQKETGVSLGSPARSFANFFRFELTCINIKATTARINDNTPNNKVLSPSAAGAPAPAAGFSEPGAGTVLM